MNFKDMYNDPIIGKRRNGNPSDPYLQIEETLQVTNGRAVLTEIPNRFEKVRVSDNMNSPWFEVIGESTDNQYSVDYSEGVVFFDSIHNGKSLTFTYLGEGVHLFPAQRIYLDDEDLSDNYTPNVKDKLKQVDTAILEQKARVDEHIDSVPQPSEVVDMRIDHNGKEFPVAKDRIDAEQMKIEEAYMDKNGKVYPSLRNRINGEQEKIEEAYHDKNNTVFQSLKDRIDSEQTKIEDAYKDKNNLVYESLKERIDGEQTKIEDVQEELNTGSAYYHNIKLEELYDEQTKTEYRFVTIPQYDENGEKVVWKRGFGGDIPNGGVIETAHTFATRHNASVTVNASTFNTSSFKLEGLQIFNGQVINDEYPNQRIDRNVLGIKDDGSFVHYVANTPSSTILADGVKNALTGFLPLIKDGMPVPDFFLMVYSAASLKYRRQVIGQLQNGDYFVLSTQSDTYGDVGFDVWDCIRVAQHRGAKFAFMLDGGGSMQTVIRGVNVVPPKDEEGTKDRLVPDFLYIGKPTVLRRDKDIRDVAGDVGYLKQSIEKNRSDIYNKTDMLNGYIRLKAGSPDYNTQGIETWAGDTKQVKLLVTKDHLAYYDYSTESTIFKVTKDGEISVKGQPLGVTYSTIVDDINTVTGNGDYWITPTTKTGSPDTAYSWSVQHTQLDAEGKFAIQVATQFTNPTIRKARRKNNGVWEAWL